MCVDAIDSIIKTRDNMEYNNYYDYVGLPMEAVK